MWRIVALSLLVACGADDGDLGPDAATRSIDAAPADVRSGLPDDGFGFACKSTWQPDHVITACTSSEGLAGFCDGGVCRRRCAGTAGGLRSCPRGQRVTPIPEQECVCEPLHCLGEPNCLPGERG